MTKQLLFSWIIFLPFTLLSQEQQKKAITPILHQIIEQDGIDKAIAKYNELKASQDNQYDFSFPQLNNLGYQLIGEKKLAEALRIFEVNQEAFPDMIRSQYSYGYGLLKNGLNDRAVLAYQKGLENMAKTEGLTASQKEYFTSLANAQINIATKLNRSDHPDFSYVGNCGGGPAANWDVETLLAFQSAKEDISINYEGNNFYNNPVPDFILDKFEADPKPDVVSGFVKGVYRDPVKNMELLDLSYLWEENSWEKAFPAAIKQAVSYDGKPYFVPITFQWNPIWYRKDIFDKVGIQPPKSWEELLMICEKLHAAGYLPFTTSGEGWEPPSARWFSILCLRLHGPQFYESLMAGQISWMDKRIKTVFDHWKILFDHHAFDPKSGTQDWQFAVADLAEGKAAMWNIGEWLWEFGPIQEQAEHIGFFPMPSINPDIPKAEILHLYGAHALPTSHHQLATEFLSYLGSESVQRANHAALKYRIPAHLKAYDQLSPIQKEQYDYIQTIDHLVPLFEFNTHPEIAKEALKAFVAFWQNPELVSETMQRIENKRKEVYEIK